MIFLLRSLSRSKSKSSVVYDEEKQVEEEFGVTKGNDEEDRTSCTALTVWRKSLVLSCTGFTVIDSNGCLAFRVDNYIGHPQQVFLMDANGQSILTIHRRKGLRLVDDWLIYEGEPSSGHQTNSLSSKNQNPPKKPKPLYHVKKHINFFQANSNANKCKVLAQVYSVGSTAVDHESDRRKSVKISPVFLVEGLYCQRSCKVVEYVDGNVNELKKTRVVAEIRSKETINGWASFGPEVFDLIVWPGFDTALAMSLVLLLGQMFT